MIATGPIYDAVDVPSQHLLLFCENAGVIRALSTNTGAVRELVRPLARGCIWRVHLSTDEKVIGIGYRPGYDDASDSPPFRIQLWNLDPALQRHDRADAVG